MKYTLWILFVCLHLLIVFTRSFNAIVPGQAFEKNEKVNTLLDTYTQFSVIQADYSFFSPDVGSSPYLLIKVQENDSSYMVPFDVKNGEMGLRLFTSLNAFNNTPEARELMARSWAAYALKQHSTAEAITVAYYLRVPPTYTDYARGKSAIDSLMYEVKYQVNEE